MGWHERSFQVVICMGLKDGEGGGRKGKTRLSSPADSLRGPHLVSINEMKQYYDCKKKMHPVSKEWLGGLCVSVNILDKAAEFEVIYVSVTWELSPSSLLEVWSELKSSQVSVERKKEIEARNSIGRAVGVWGIYPGGRTDIVWNLQTI